MGQFNCGYLLQLHICLSSGYKNEIPQPVRLGRTEHSVLQQFICLLALLPGTR